MEVATITCPTCGAVGALVSRPDAADPPDRFSIDEPTDFLTKCKRLADLPATAYRSALDCPDFQAHFLSLTGGA
jgi:hypothetical protein